MLMMYSDFNRKEEKRITFSSKFFKIVMLSHNFHDFQRNFRVNFKRKFSLCGKLLVVISKDFLT